MAELLQPVGKGIVHIVVLENINPSIQQNFPAMVCDDMARMYGADKMIVAPQMGKAALEQMAAL